MLADLIASDRLPVVRLTEIFRQAAASRIVQNAHRVNRGLMPVLDRPDERLSDFYAIKARGPEDGARLVLELVTERIPERFGVDPVADIQVLCPTNRGELGARHLNQMLQAALNPGLPDRLEHHGVSFALGDKVMQLENDYDREVYNGDLGRVMRIDRAQNLVTIEIDGRPLSYDVSELDALAPAYATTVHKAQGSEYPVVVLPLAGITVACCGAIWSIPRSRAPGAWWCWWSKATRWSWRSQSARSRAAGRGCASCCAPDAKAHESRSPGITLFIGRAAAQPTPRALPPRFPAT